MLLLGVIQAQASGAVAGSFDLLETQVLSSSAASVTFSGLSTYAADYQHLQIRMTHQSNRSNGSNPFIRINGATSTVYSVHNLRGNGSSVSSGGYANEAQIFFDGGTPGSNFGASNFAAAVVDLLDPFDTNKFTTTRALNGWASGHIGLHSGVYRATTAVDSITFLLSSGDSFTANSRFSLYGIKAA